MLQVQQEALAPLLVPVQAELLVGMLDAYGLFREPAYWDVFENVYGFVFDRFVNMPAGGEWYERLNREGEVVDAALGHAYKISYHTVRSVIQSIKRLEALIGKIDARHSLSQL